MFLLFLLLSSVPLCLAYLTSVDVLCPDQCFRCFSGLLQFINFPEAVEDNLCFPCLFPSPLAYERVKPYLLLALRDITPLLDVDFGKASAKVGMLYFVFPCLLYLTEVDG